MCVGLKSDSEMRHGGISVLSALFAGLMTCLLQGMPTWPDTQER